MGEDNQPNRSKVRWQEIYKLPVAPGAYPREDINAALDSERIEYRRKVGVKEWERRRVQFQEHVEAIEDPDALSNSVREIMIKDVREYIQRIWSGLAVGPQTSGFSEYDWRYRHYLSEIEKNGEEMSIRELLFCLSRVADLERQFETNPYYWGNYASVIRKNPDRSLTKQEWIRYSVSVLARSPRLLTQFGMERLQYAPEVLGRPIKLIDFNKDEVNYGRELDTGKLEPPPFRSEKTE